MSAVSVVAMVVASFGVLALLAGVLGVARFHDVLERTHAMRAGALGGTAALVGLALSASSAATVLKLLLLALALAAGSAFAAFWIAAEHRAEEGREP